MKNTALIFPGQGSQYVSMGKDIAEAFSEAKYVFEELDEILSRKLSKIIFEGPIEELTMTINTQPALMAVSMAIISVLKKQINFEIKDQAKYVAGHSLGEYTALAVAGSLDFKTTSKILNLRGQSMQESSPFGYGSMVALMGASIEEASLMIEEASQGEICQIANDNTIGQIVISGKKEAIDRLAEIAKNHGKKTIILPVSAAFHSKLMGHATNIMREALNQTIIKDPVIELISNVTAKPVKDSDKIKSLLVEQIEGRVRWRETVIYMMENNIENYIEIGPSKILSNLVKKIHPNSNIININNVENLHNFMENFSKTK